MTYRVAEVATDGQYMEIYATTPHVFQLKSWKILREVVDEEEDQLGISGDVRHEVDEGEGQPGLSGDVRHEIEVEVTGAVRPRRTRKFPTRFND